MRKIFNILLALVVAVILVMVIYLWTERNSKVNLPAPTGKYAVGRTSFEWTDTSRIDSLAMEAGKKRKLFLWVWYPAENNQKIQASDYLPREWRDAEAERQGPFSKFLTRKLEKVQSHSVDHARIAGNKDRFPLILIKSGIGPMTTDYTTFAEDLASNGYVVIGSESPYSSNVVVFAGNQVVNDNSKGNPSGDFSAVDRNLRLDRLVTIWTDDLHFILDRLEKLDHGDSIYLLYRRLDLKKTGIFGHSLGGAAAFRFCFDDPRCKAGASIEGIPVGHIAELTKPFMFLTGDFSDKDSSGTQVRSIIEKIYRHLPQGSVWAKIKGAKHYNFSDQALIRERFFAKKAGDTGNIGRRKGLEITAACLRTFFDIHLKGKPISRASELSKQYPQITLQIK
jgi:dienelactone hydrolase